MTTILTTGQLLGLIVLWGMVVAFIIEQVIQYWERNEQ